MCAITEPNSVILGDAEERAGRLLALFRVSLYDKPE
jgi:hypothetical protein